MSLSPRTRMATRALLGPVVLLIALMPTHLPTPLGMARSAAATSSHPCVTMAGAGDTPFVRNFNPFGSYLDFTLGGIYESLYIITTAGGGHSYPWLATGYTFTDHNRTVRITIRQGVKWSDGQPFTAKDVFFTYTAGTRNAALDQIGYMPRRTSNIASVTLVGANQVAVHYKKADTTVLPTLLSNIKIIPAHIWSKVTNPATFTNPHPVGTGPFTQVQNFSSQYYVLGKNPHYWQAGKPAVPCLKRILSQGTDSWLLPALRGEVDWTHNFIADVQRVYVQRDPAHYHYYYATNNTPVGLFYNDTFYPWRLVNFRKALSMAIDRQKVWRIAEYGYEPPADAIGIAHAFPSWVDHRLDAQAKALTTYDPAGARALLAKSGFTWKGGQLYDPKGHRVSVTLSVIGGWPDWVLTMQIISKDFKALGIDTSLRLSGDYPSWAASADKGLSTHLHWTYGGATPYYYFNSYMSRVSYVPTGTDAGTTGNWSRWWSPEATRLLAQFRQTTDVGTQHAIIDKLQQIQLRDFPYIPVMIGASWYTYSTKYFTGWPTPSTYYAAGGPGTYPDQALVMTRLTPVK